MKTLRNLDFLKLAALLLLALPMASAHAVDGGDEDLDFPDPFPSPPSMRNARLNIQVEKSSVVSGPAGPEWRRETVCVRSVDIEVYDLRHLDDANIAAKFNVRCPTTSSQGPLDLFAGGYISFTRTGHSGSGVETQKNFSLFTSLAFKSGILPDPRDRNSSANTSTPNLETKSASISLHGGMIVTPGGGTQLTQETFTTTAIFDDSHG